MRVLITGSEGHIGSLLAQTLLAAGHEIRTFDRAPREPSSAWEHHRGDLRDITALRRAVEGIDAVAHLGAIANDSEDIEPNELLAINVQGTWNALLACVEAGVERMIYFSSINALGCVGGYRKPVYLPLDDTYPRHPMSPYQLSKHLGEEMCRSFSDKHGLITLSLRPVGVLTEESYGRYRECPSEERAEAESVELWAYVDRRDICEATLLALSAQNVTQDAFLLAAADTTQEIPTADLVDRYYSDIPWNAGERAAYFAENPYRSLLDCSRAERVLGWRPKHSWRD